MSHIHLVRHGRSAHVHAGWVDLAGFHRWRESYEAAAIVEGEVPPPALTELAATAGTIVSSDAPAQSPRRSCSAVTSSSRRCCASWS